MKRAVAYGTSWRGLSVPFFTAAKHEPACKTEQTGSHTDGGCGDKRVNPQAAGQHGKTAAKHGRTADERGNSTRITVEQSHENNG